MRLKKLTLFGFKSFPNRTKVEFNRGICAIVGPNGCGKSNVVDAIRWVLGEQSAKMLRARSMDDVIFSGSNGRNISFAEVSLVLENSAGMAPPEFENLSEIEIKRMVSRKGDTRYLINGKNCRLKDIHYLLMDTGAGTRAYSIVDQGQVGQFVEMSPGERRHIIEEVAGISRYKARRVEAERRMADTSRNLERLTDLMSEVERQLRSASRQARKTERYLELRREQELHDKALLKYAWDEQEERLQGLERDMELAQEALQAAEAALSMLRADRERINSGLLEKEQGLKTLKSGLSGAEELLDQLRHDMAGAEKELYRTRLALQGVEKNSRESERRAEGAMRRHREVVETLSSLSAELRQLQAEEQEAARYVEEGLVHVEQVRQELEEVKVQLVDAAAEQARLDSERRGLRERAKRLETRIEKRQQEKRALSDRIASLREEHSRMEARAGELESALAEKTEQQKQARNQLEGIISELSEVREKFRDAGARLAAAEARLEALRAVDAAGEGIPAEVQELIKGESGVLGLLADFIEVERGWERVFETVLGPGLYALVVDSKETCLRLAASFRAQATGTLSIIVAGLEHAFPMGEGTASAEDEVAHGEGNSVHNPSMVALPALSDRPDPAIGSQLYPHVKAAPALVPALANFLRNAVFVHTLDECFQHISSQASSAGQPGSAFRLPAMVTGTGETVSPWLEVTVQGGGEDRSGILVRKALIRDLEQDTMQIRQELEAISSRKDALEAAESEKKRLVMELGQKVERTGRELSRLSRDLDAVKLKVESAASRMEVMDFEIKEAGEELLDVEFTLEERETALEECGSRNQELSASLRGREGALRQQEGVLERRRQKQQELRIRITRIESSIKEREKERHRIERQQERIRHDSRNFVSEKKRLEQEVSGQEKILSQASAKVSAQETAVADARSRTAVLEQERDTVLQEISAYDQKISAQDQVVRKAEKKVHAMEVDISESRQALQFIGQSSLERHNISAAAITGVEQLLETMEPEAMKQKLNELKEKLNRMGAVNLGALDEYNELRERKEFLDEQKQDLEKSMADLKQAIDKINRTCRSRFRDALEAVNRSLEQVFPLLFDGGSARLQIESNDDILEAGVEYLVNLPGKKIQHLNLLSGGEKTMAAMALLFAVYFIKPSPFCLLDEVDAPLDEANTVRFNRLIKKIARESQVVIITHNQRVMDTADILYGVTMEDRGVSKIVSVNLVS